MYKIMGSRGCGKTTTLIKYASENNCIVVEPTSRMRDYAREKAKQMGYDNVTIIAQHEMYDTKDKFLIDELDCFLSLLGVVGYSNTIEDQRETKANDI